MYETILAKAREYYMAAEAWLMAPDTLIQIIAISLALVAALIADRLVRPLAGPAERTIPYFNRMLPFLRSLSLPFFWLVLVGMASWALLGLGRSNGLLTAAANLLTAWLIIRFISLFIKNTDLARLFAIVAWTLAALKISGLLQPIADILDLAALEMGTTRVSLLTVIKGLITFALMIWAALFITRLLENSLARVPTLTPSAQVLLSKLIRIFLVTVAVLAAVTSVGINWAALAVVGGAVGVGIGFGLQKVVSNLISGVILLLDRSIKPGDVVEVGETYGWINKLAARYTSVITRDGREHLVPNEDMITQPVINWTYSHTRVRRPIPVGVSYKSDLRKAMALTEEAALEVSRVLKDPKPQCLVKEFGEFRVLLELRIWIADPHNGVSNVASEVMLRIWDKFHEHGIEIPYPQHDLHLLSAPALETEEVRALMEKLKNT
jgi:small-conductance mechanosensitive channel